MKEECRTLTEIQPYLLPNGHFDAEKFKVRFDLLLKQAIIKIFKQKRVCKFLIIEPQFARYTNITNFRVIWRGSCYKDMTIKIDVVPAILCEQAYSVFCPGVHKSQFYVFFKFKSKECFPVDHSDVELKSICKLKKNIRKGYAFAKAIRLSALLQQSFLTNINVEDIHDCLRTYLLKICLLFCTERLCLHLKHQFEILTPMKWAYLLYNHLEARLLDGEIPIWFNVDPTFTTRIGAEVVFQCYHSLDVAVDEEAPCCTKQKALLALTRFFLKALKAFCEYNGCDMNKLEDCVKQVRQLEVPGLQEIIGYYVQGKRPVKRAFRPQH